MILGTRVWPGCPDMVRVPGYIYLLNPKSWSRCLAHVPSRPSQNDVVQAILNIAQVWFKCPDMVGLSRNCQGAKVWSGYQGMVRVPRYGRRVQELSGCPNMVGVSRNGRGAQVWLGCQRMVMVLRYSRGVKERSGCPDMVGVSRNGQGAQIWSGCQGMVRVPRYG